MNLKIYERTRYQNIYRNKKKKNYVIMISKPVKTTISRIDDKPITTLEEALKIRDNPKIKMQKGIETLHKEDFDSLWISYMNECKVVKKQAYNTIQRKDKTYNKYLKGKITKLVSKITKEEWAIFIDNCICSNKQKNQIIKELKTFYNWCLNDKKCVINNPISKIKKYTVVNKEMKYWIPNEIQQFFQGIDKIILNADDLNEKEIAYRTKILVLIEFNLGDRVGETRALTFDCFDNAKSIVKIFHSINYDRKSQDYLSNTKNYQSQRIIDVSEKLIVELNNYKRFLISECDYDVKNDSLIFWNYKNNCPYSDVALRKQFYKYCDIIKVKRIRMYDLRHTYVATMMSEGKELYLFSQRIGHKKIDTTISKYGHLSTEVRKELAQTTDKYF